MLKIKISSASKQDWHIADKVENSTSKNSTNNPNRIVK